MQRTNCIGNKPYPPGLNVWPQVGLIPPFDNLNQKVIFLQVAKNQQMHYPQSYKHDVRFH
jgi:hypothetical protein